MDSSKKRLIITATVIVIMAGLMFKSDKMAYGYGRPEETRWLYMFAHASWLHLAINSYMLLMLHHIMYAHRVIAAYLASVLVTYIYSPAIPVVGMSTMILFIVGYTIPYRVWKHGITAVVVLVVILLLGMIVPEIAGIYHVLCALLGLMYYYAEGITRRIYIYIIND